MLLDVCLVALCLYFLFSPQSGCRGSGWKARISLQLRLNWLILVYSVFRMGLNPFAEIGRHKAIKFSPPVGACPPDLKSYSRNSIKGESSVVDGYFIIYL